MDGGRRLGEQISAALRVLGPPPFRPSGGKERGRRNVEAKKAVIDDFILVYQRSSRRSGRNGRHLAAELVALSSSIVRGAC
jgi:hypothetical protein